MFQKLASRQIALEKCTSTTDKDKKRWKECFVEDLISSEDSEEDGSFRGSSSNMAVRKSHQFLLLFG